MPNIFRDVRYGFRSLVKSPALTLVAIFALTLGIGLTTTMFSIVYGALLKGLPFPDGDRIVVLSRDNKAHDINNADVPITDVDLYRTNVHALSEIALVTSGTMNVSGAEKAERYDGSWVSANMFRMLGVQPVAGRDFRPGEDTPSGARVAIISYSMWENRFNKSDAAVGQTIRVNGTPFEVIGVMPPKFEFPTNDRIWLPVQVDPLAAKRASAPAFQVVGKLAPGATLDQASVEANGVQARLSTDNKDTDEGYTASVRGFADSVIGPQPRQLLLTMLGAVFFVLLIACSNVANLLIDRAAHRSKEVGIRSALGASRGAIVRQFLAEASLLAIAGTVLGVVVAKLGLDVFTHAVTVTQIPFFIDFSLHPPVFAFTAGVALLATVFSGMIPAFQSSRADINEILKDETRGSSSLRIGKISKALVMFEVALSCALLVAAALMVKSVAKMRTMDPGFTTRDVFTARVGFPAGYTDTVQQRQFFVQFAEQVAALPGVDAAAVSSGLPGARQSTGGTNFAVEGKSYVREADYPQTRTESVTPGFFSTLSIPIREGRAFGPQDRFGSQPVAIVNERFARQFFGSESPVGRRIRYGGATSTQPWLTVVGVVPTVFAGNPNDPRPPMVLRPLEQEHSNFNYISARVAGNPLSLLTPVRDVAARLNPDIPLYWVMTYDKAIEQQLWFVQVFGTMFMIFGFIALFLAAVGLYAVMSFSVSRRTREVGIRMALGAQARDVIRMIFRQGLWQVGVGLVVGLALALGISSLLGLILFDVQPRDPQVFGGVAALLMLTGLGACLIPARRATRVDPLHALRTD
ncbi:MAG TPA: ABC transporter permease [Gemmatimonadaceae bacterium]|nr:ABC transporter permease [Gemmatimonadaceae bacterium]